MSATKFLDLKVGEAYFSPNPHADFLTIHVGGEEVTIRGVDFWEYVGACRKRQCIDQTVEWLESQPASAYVSEESRPGNFRLSASNHHQPAGAGMSESVKELSGRELDRAVAERVMGQPMPPIVTDCRLLVDKISTPDTAWNHVHYYERGDECEWEPLPFSESIEAAMQVVEKIRECGWRTRIGDHIISPTWRVEMFQTSDDLQWTRRETAESGSLAEAICRAALTAVEHQ